jgi:glucose/arabinose dehydrogenase
MVMRKHAVVYILTWTCIVSSLGYVSPYALGQQSGFTFAPAFPNLTFTQPDGIFSDPTNSNRLFVTEQTGVINVFNNSQTTTASTVFLDISNRVLVGGEEGLLGLAFDPNFNQNHYFYLNYVADNPLRTVIARYTVSADPNVADKASERIVMQFNQPYTNHKGGQLAFGPDGYLYIGVGDGGSEGDPRGNGQNRSTLLGKILRIDVNSASVGKNYSVPTDNSFIGGDLGSREEIYAYGFRNPWRFSFDSATGILWVGDVGQDRLEEVDIVEKGKNYGWNLMEGTLMYDAPTGFNQSGLELPIWNYTHDIGNAVIGGYVYRGSDLPSLVGAYVYGDYGSGRIWALRYNGTATNTELVNTGLSISSFGLDQQSELFFTAYNGKIYRLATISIPEFPWQAFLAVLLAATVPIAVSIKKRVRGVLALISSSIPNQAFNLAAGFLVIKNGLSTALSIGISLGPSPTPIVSICPNVRLYRFFNTLTALPLSLSPVRWKYLPP